MECFAAVIRVFAALLISLMLCGAALAQERVVLVASETSRIESMSSFEVRKLYMGISVMKNGRFVRALRNVSDARLNSVFLQSVVGLSEERYERRLLSNLLKYGTARPQESADLDTLVQTLGTDPFAVTYVWVRDGETLDGVKILRVLWQEF